MMADAMDLLEDRIALMERKVFGHSEPDSSEVPQTPISDTLVQTGRTLSAATAGRDKVYNIMKRLQELNDLVEMSCDESSMAAKLEMVLAKAAELQTNLARLECAQRLVNTVLDNPQASENLIGVDALNDRLCKLSLLTTNNLGDFESLNEQVQHLYVAYNTIVNDLRMTFLVFEELVSKKEAEASAVKVPD